MSDVSKFPLSKLKSFPLDMLLSHLLSAISSPRELFFFFVLFPVKVTETVGFNDNYKSSLIITSKISVLVHGAISRTRRRGALRHFKLSTRTTLGSSNKWDQPNLSVPNTQCFCHVSLRKCFWKVMTSN